MNADSRTILRVTFDEAVDIVSQRLGYDVKRARDAIEKAMDRGEIEGKVSTSSITHTAGNEIHVVTGLAPRYTEMSAASLEQFIATRESLVAGQGGNRRKQGTDNLARTAVPEDTRAAVPPLVLPLPRHQAQEEAILTEIKRLKHDAAAIPKPMPGKPGLKAKLREKLRKNAKLFQSDIVFEKAWERLRRDGAIRDAK